MSKEEVDLSIIIVNWNTCDLLGNCLASVYSKPCHVEFEVYVVDNASADNSVDMVTRDYPQVKLIVNNENAGYAKANNIAMELCQGHNILLLNSDTIVDPDVFNTTIELLRSRDDIGSLGCCLIGLDGSIQESWKHKIPGGPTIGISEEPDANGLVKCGYVWGAYHLVKREVIDQVGMLDKGFFMFYEDVDWCWRMYKAGWYTVYDPNHSIIHIYRASCNRTVSYKQQVYMLVSQRRLFEKHLSRFKSWYWRMERLFHFGLRFICLYIVCRVSPSKTWHNRLECLRAFVRALI